MYIKSSKDDKFLTARFLATSKYLKILDFEQTAKICICWNSRNWKKFVGKPVLFNINPLDWFPFTVMIPVKVGNNFGA